ncbi:YeiH family protein [Microbacteriaceae bacterium 4G12]
MEPVLVAQRKKPLQLAGGIGLTLVIAILAKYIAQLPFFQIMGQLVIAILLGMLWRASIGVQERTLVGANFASKKLLRFGIILLGMRLNIMDMVRAGSKVIVLAVAVITFALLVVYTLTRLFKVDKRLGMLTACGTAICGAAAIAAIAPQIKAKDEETAVGAATIAILGTVFTLAYTLLYPVLGLSPYAYGVFSGSTLHEIAHVIAAAAPGGNSAVDIAVIVKLTRVALLVPVAIIIGFWYQRTEQTGEKTSWRDIPIPWFIFGFLAMSVFHSLGIVSEAVASNIVVLAYMLLAMAMAGLGLNVEWKTFRKLGVRTFIAGFIGSVLLSGFGYILVHVLHFA